MHHHLFNRQSLKSIVVYLCIYCGWRCWKMDPQLKINKWMVKTEDLTRMKMSSSRLVKLFRRVLGNSLKVHLKVGHWGTSYDTCNVQSCLNQWIHRARELSLSNKKRLEKSNGRIYKLFHSIEDGILHEFIVYSVIELDYFIN